MAGRTAEDYDEKDLHTHIYDVPDTYVGSTNLDMKEEIIFDLETKRMRKVKMDLPDAVKRIVMEIISNAGDNAYFSRISGTDPGMLSLSCNDEGYLSVRNGGQPIPVEPHKNSTPDDLYLLPTNIFSVLLTSSNYNKEKDRTGCGRNGYGSKLTNIFSKHFIVKVGDSGRVIGKKKLSGQEYYGEWKDNMWNQVKAEATPGFEFKGGKWERITKGEYTGESYVEVTWKTDFKRMHMKREYFTNEEFGLFARYMIEFSLTCGVPVKINEEVFDMRSIRDFARLYYDDDLVDRAIVAYDDKRFPEAFKKLKNGKSQERFIAEKFIPETQFILLDTPKEAMVHSYVNGLMTPDGGVHLDKLKNKMTLPVVKAFNDKHGKGKIRKDDILPHVSIFLVNRLKNTEYESQSKKRLTKPTPQIDIDPKVAQVMLSKEWKLMEFLESTILAKTVKDMTKTDGKKVAHLNISKEFDDANEAGRSKSHECTLYIVEGHSAAGYARNRIADLPGGKDFNGVYPLQGKVMNVKTHSMEKILAYEELKNIKQVVGLRQGMDYSVDKNYKSLRYGKIMINVDADSDGMHIMGLILNLFREFWKELYLRNFVQLLVTPVVRVFHGKKVYRFYDERSFGNWFEKNKDITPKPKINYYKGLGSSSDADITEDVKTAPVLVMDLDKKGEDLIELAFDGTRSDDRKHWISEWRDERDSVKPFEPTKLVEHRHVSEMMGKSFPPYMTDSIIRAIPSKFDGLKRSQRQVAYYALHHFNYGSSKKTEKIIAFSPGVVPYSKYHHGDKSLNDTVLKMVRPFCNGNNMPFFFGEGRFGTRGALGKDAAQPRYTSVGAQWWFELMYDKNIVELVDKKMVDGEAAEPYWLAQTIPLGLVNGNKGMATGYSSFIPMHHPCDIADWFIARLEGKKRIEPVVPFYNGFTGEIHIYSKSKKRKEVIENEDIIVDSDGNPVPPPPSSISSEDQNHDSDDEDPNLNFTNGRGFDIYGKYEYIEIDKHGRPIEYDKDGSPKKDPVGNKCNIIITELPFTVARTKYIKFIKDLIDKKIAEDVRDTSNDKLNTVRIEVKGLKTSHASYEKLGLKSGLPLTNMYLIDNDGIPRKYGSIESILAEYVEHMAIIYRKYKDLIIGKHEDELKKMGMELAIIEAYLAGKLIVHKKSDEEVDAQLEKLNLDKKTFEKINLRGLTKTRVDALKKKISDLEAELKAFRKRTEQDLWKERLVALKEGLNKKKIFSSTYEIIDDAKNPAKRVYIDGELSYKEALVKFHSI